MEEEIKKAIDRYSEVMTISAAERDFLVKHFLDGIAGKLGEIFEEKRKAGLSGGLSIIVTPSGRHRILYFDDTGSHVTEGALQGAEE